MSTIPYYHIKDSGKIHFWRRKCSICGKKWPISALFSFDIPKGMTKFQPAAPAIKKGKTTYAGWGDKIPFVGTVASRLPNWPRWARILAVILLIGTVIIIVCLIGGLLS